MHFTSRSLARRRLKSRIVRGSGTLVLAAVVKRDSCVLRAKRSLHERHGGLWEFPGCSVAVAPEARGTWSGRALTDDRPRWAEAQGLEAVYLLTTTAAEYWPRFGFEPIGRDEAPAVVRRSSEWSEICPASSVAMRKVLPAGPR